MPLKLRRVGLAVLGLSLVLSSATFSSAAAIPKVGGGVIVGGRFFDDQCPPLQPRLAFDFVGRVPIGRTFYQATGHGSSIWGCVGYSTVTLSGATLLGQTFESKCSGKWIYLSTGLIVGDVFVSPALLYRASCATVGYPGAFDLTLAFQGVVGKAQNGYCCWHRPLIGAFLTVLRS